MSSDELLLLLSESLSFFPFLVATWFLEVLEPPSSELARRRFRGLGGIEDSESEES